MPFQFGFGIDRRHAPMRLAVGLGLESVLVLTDLRPGALWLDGSPTPMPSHGIWLHRCDSTNERRQNTKGDRNLYVFLMRSAAVLTRNLCVFA